MKSKNLIWLGLGAIALYLYFKKSPAKETPKPNVSPLPNPILPIPIKPKPNPLPSIKPNKEGKKKYRVIKKLQSGGYVPIKGKMVAMNDLFPKVGDIIELEDAKETYIFNKWLVGHSFVYAISDNGPVSMFIDSSEVEKV